jgi:protein-disulfide isomerase
MKHSVFTVVAALAVIVIAGGAWLVLRDSVTGPQTAGPRAPTEEGVLALRPVDRILGAADAPVTIIEYASFTCLHCGSFHNETLPQLRTEWIDTGRAQLVFRDSPGDRLALAAAMAARCAPEPQYYPLVSLLFREQEAWLRSPDPVGALERIVATAGMGPETFASCVADQDMQNEILGHQIAARDEASVDSTPTFFVNGRRIIGNQSYDELNRILEAAAGS